MKTDQRHDEVIKRSPLRIIELDPQTDPRWEALINSLSTSVIYQHPAWLGVLEEAYGYKPLHLACEDSTGALHGVLPLFYRRGLRTGRVCLSSSPIAGPLADDEEARLMLIQAAIERSREERAVQFQFTTRSTSFDHLMNDVVGVPLDETYELTLPEQPEHLRLDSKIRWAVKKATRLGVQIRPAETIGDLRAWYTLYLQTMRRLAVVPRPYRMFDLAWQRMHSQGLLQLLLAEQIEAGQRRLLSGFLYLRWKHMVSHHYTGWRREAQDLRPNDLLHWHAMQNACTEGFRSYDFGSVNVGNHSLAQFKTKWGAEPRTIYRYSYPLSSHTGTISTLQVSDRVHQSISALRRLVTPLWQRLPLNATELAGEWFWIVH